MCNTVNGPGKFEGEECYAEECRKIVMDGGQDETFYDESGNPVDLISVDLEFVERHPSVHCSTAYIACWTSKSGFFFAREWTQKEYQRQEQIALEIERETDTDTDSARPR